ncbi:MAG: glycosyltransferase family 4 protein, partial [Chloroflexota bacterium]|nr:glycosyltransferase family 4 protein [Chloroflexota bacterium]
VIFCPSALVPPFSSTPLVMTIFDLTPLRFGGTQDPISRQYATAMLRLGARRSAAICTISSAVRDEIVARFPTVPPGSVHVAYPGPNPELLAAPDTRPSIPDHPFVLMVGTVEPRKNHITAVRALAEHCRRRPASPLILVAAGSAGWRYEPVDRAISELGLSERVIRIGNVEPGTLKWLYRRATALLFPSLYEGFGLPVLEALSLECPVVASRIPSVAEITGDGAMLLEPTDVPGWTAALAAVEDGRGWGLSPAAGLERARRFTWDGCAESALAAISAAIAPS